MNGYKHIFDSANIQYQKYEDKDYLYRSFRARKDVYGFIENGDTPPDEESVRIAINLDFDLYKMYQKSLEDRKLIGYEGSTANYASYNNLDSRHIMMSVILFHHAHPKNILEIGGGYGNWLYLNRNMDFENWKIIDIPHVSLLQNYTLCELGVDKRKYELINTENIESIKTETFDAIIGAHSLSEFSVAVFDTYYDLFIKNTKYFLYCYHNWLPSTELINYKNSRISSDFNLVYKVLTEKNNVSNCLFINKKYV